MTVKKKKKIEPDELCELLKEIKKSPILNGGFNKIMLKIESIEHNQEQQKLDQDEISNKVNLIHTAIYEPDTGIYTRIRSLSSEQDLITSQVSNWKKSIEQEIKDDKKNDENFIEKQHQTEIKIADLTTQLEQLKKLKNSFFSGIKWFLALSCGSIVTLLVTHLWQIIIV